MKNKKDYFHYDICGLDYIYLANGYNIHETPYGNGVSIDNTDVLHKVIGRFIVFEMPHIRGQELRFFRSEFGFSQTKMAHLFGTSLRTYQKWEEDKNKEINPQADRLMRIIYLEFLGETRQFKEISQILDDIQNSSNHRSKDLQLKETSSGWQIAA